jgi:hypothetical protein
LSDSRVFIPPYVPPSRRTESAPGAARARDDAFEADAALNGDESDGTREASAIREGLPAHYRMRAEPHYVEALARPPRAEAPVTERPPAAPGAAVATAIVEAVEAVHEALAAIPARGQSLRERVAVELARAEAQRARWLAEAVVVLQQEPLPALDLVDLASVLGAVAAAFGPEQRLTGGAPSINVPAGTFQVFGDERMLTAAIGGLVHAMRRLVDDRADPNRVIVRMGPRLDTAARTIEVIQTAVRVSASAHALFFEADWADHPAGPTGAVLLAAARRIAVAQGGTLDVTANEGGGCSLLFSVPAAG